MTVGTVKEIKSREYRVGLTPACVRAYRQKGHRVLVEAGAGEGSGFSDSEYRDSGAEIRAAAQEIFQEADMIVKVKEPQKSEVPLFRPGQILFTYLHLAADRSLTLGLMDRGIHGVAYETIEDRDGSLPCLTPMSEIAGRLAVQEGAKYLEKPFGGRGILLGGVPGVPRGQVVILGGGVVGTNACKIAAGIGASVTVLDINPKRLAYLDDIFGSRITTLHSTEHHLIQAVSQADVVIGAVLIPGEAAPKLLRREHLRLMQPGAVLVDVAIDQGGCAETSRMTTHDDPIFLEEGVVHYCVGNMPGAVARTSTAALTSTTLRYGLELAGSGLPGALARCPGLAKGLNISEGRLVHPGVARSLGLPLIPLSGSVL